MLPRKDLPGCPGLLQIFPAPGAMPGFDPEPLLQSFSIPHLPEQEGPSLDPMVGARAIDCVCHSHLKFSCLTFLKHPLSE